ncbi:tetraspanin [Geosmithia morbida]|uniref:Tetraspanin n=1 Tax=Geosmithia morbida TaxID=1094350 RepID=A0A9P5D253_9HYPO|nr:tetraspanin [Geosmithia morbida]KAF4124638.1 tetraspanin [Geosmithia morbida]
MANKLLIVVIVADILFLATGILELAFSVVTQQRGNRDPANGEDVIRDLVDQRLPLTPGIINGVFILASFVATLPGLLMPTTRGWLKAAGYMVTVCGLFSLILGVDLWLMTLKIGTNFGNVYVDLDSNQQELVQTSFQCCGYTNSTWPPFVTDDTCPSPAAAALLNGCKTSVASFATILFGDMFTALFGMVGIDLLFIIALACLSKERKEQIWYRNLDQKSAPW